MEPLDINIGLLSATQGLAAFHALMPTFADIRNTSPNDPEMVNAVRAGEMGGSILTGSIGLLATFLTKSPIPFVCAVIICAVNISVYETVLNRSPYSEGNK